MDKHILGRLISEHTDDAGWGSFFEADWDMLIDQAEQEGVAAIFYWKLSASGRASGLSSHNNKRLRASYAGIWKQNQKIYNELGLLADRFYKLDIQLVVLKGACYALTIYPDIGMRPMGDLDILVPVSQIPVAVQAAKSMGYEDLLPEASPGLRDLLSHEVFLQKAGTAPLEIHHSLVADKTFIYAVPMDWFWEQTEPMDAALTKTSLENLRMLSPTAQLLYAAAHAMLQHGGNKAPLCWFYDLDRIVRVHEKKLDWDLLIRQAKIFEWSSALRAALIETQEYFHTPIPVEVFADLPAQTDRLSSLVAAKKDPPATHVLAEYQKLLSLNWAGRFRLVLALAFPSPSYMRWRYHFRTNWVLPFYYLIRWWGIFADGIRTILALFRR